MHAIGASGAHAEPVLQAVLVDDLRSLNRRRLSGKPEADALEVAASGVLAGGLNHDPPRD